MGRLFNKNNPDYVDFGDVAKIIGDEITISCWVKLDSVNGDQKLVAKWADVGPEYQYLISVTNNETSQFAVQTPSYSGVVVGSTIITTGLWHNIVGRYNGSNVKVYLNGVEDGTQNWSGNLNNANSPLVLGAGSSGSGGEVPLDGCLGHVAIWDVALSSDEVTSLSNGINPMQIRPEGLVFYNPLNGQSPEPDIVGGELGTVNGTTVVGEPPISNSIKAP